MKVKVIKVSPGADGGQFHHKKVISTAFIFLSRALGGSSEADRGLPGLLGVPRGSWGFSEAAQGHMGGSLI